jgi:antirestriction protein ArdC
MDVYAIVTDKIVNLLEQEVIPWRRPWASLGLPRNLVSQKPYRGINHFCFLRPSTFHRFG